MQMRYQGQGDEHPSRQRTFLNIILVALTMRALYCQSEESFLELLRPMFEELDALYWVVDCQMGPVKSEWIYESAAREQAYEDMHIPVPEFERSGARLWRPGSLSHVRDALYFDEWSYLIGFRAAVHDARSRAGRLGLAPPFTPKFYQMIEDEAELFIVQVDGWWEFYPSNDTWFTRIRDCATCREIAPRPNHLPNWRLQFL